MRRTRSPHVPGDEGAGDGRAACRSRSSPAPSHFARAEIERLGLDAGILGHAGDGNLHVAVQVEPGASRRRPRSSCTTIVDDALARGGTCTGEHGIGLGKIDALVQEHGDLIPLMQAIKASFDPNGILNPGKVLPEKSVAASPVSAVRPFRLGVDIGGTFTDVVLLGDDGSVRTAKVLSTPDDYARGVVDGRGRAARAPAA